MVLGHDEEEVRVSWRVSLPLASSSTATTAAQSGQEEEGGGGGGGGGEPVLLLSFDGPGVGAVTVSLGPAALDSLEEALRDAQEVIGRMDAAASSR